VKFSIQKVKKELTVSLLEARKRQESMKKGSFKSLVQSTASNQLERKQLAPITIQPSDSYLKKLRVKINATAVKPQSKPHARIVNESDPRNNPYSMFCAVSAYVKDLPKGLVFNFDGTQFVYEQDSDGKLVLVIKQKRDLDAEGDEAVDENGLPFVNNPVAVKSAGKLDSAYKLIHFNNDAGYASRPVFVVADDSMSGMSL